MPSKTLVHKALHINFTVMICLISLQPSPMLKEIASILKAPSMIILWEKDLFHALTTLANIFRNVVHVDVLEVVI